MSTSTTEVDRCDPWPIGGPHTCAPDAAHFTGEPGCAVVGSACPADDWADGLPQTDILFVRAGASPSGTGTRAAPFSTIAEAIQMATPGTTIALSKGTFEEPVVLPSGVTLWGACVAETVITATASETAPIITARSDDSVLRNLQVSGPRGGISSGPGSLQIEEVVVSGATGFGWRLTGGRASARTFVVRNTQSWSDLTGGRGVDARSGAIADLARVALISNRDRGLVAVGAGTVVTLADVVVRETMSRASDRAIGRGIDVQAGARVEISRAALEQNRDIGLLLWQESTTASISDVVIRHTAPTESSDRFGFGLLAQDGAAAGLHRVWLANNRGVGLSVYGTNARVEAENLIVSDTEGLADDGSQGFGISVWQGGSLTMRYALLERNRTAAVIVMESSDAQLVDVTIRDTRFREQDGSMGFGVFIRSGSHASLHRALLERNLALGLDVGGTGSRSTVEDLVVRDTKPRGLGEQEGGFGLHDGAEAEVTRALFERNPVAGLWARNDGSHLTLTDVTVRNTEPREGLFGRGISVQDRATINVTRALLQDNHEFGLYASDSGTALYAVDIVVEETALTGSNGVGLLGQNGAQVAAERAVFRANHTVGVAATSSTTMTLADISIRETLPAPDDTLGIGLLVTGRAQVTAERLSVVDNHHLGTLVWAGATLTASDVEIRGTSSQRSNQLGGAGLEAHEDAQVTLERALLSQNRSTGVFVADQARIALKDVVIRDTESVERDDSLAAGLAVQSGAHADLTRVLVERSRGLGISGTDPESTIQAVDLIVRDTHGTARDGLSGRGLSVSDGVSVVIERALFERNREMSIASFGTGAVVTMSDVTVRETLERECVTNTCAEAGGGTGVGSVCGATLELNRFLIEGSALAGVQLARGVRASGACQKSGVMDLHDGEIARNTIGANVQAEGFDLNRLSDRVIYRDNDRKLVSITLPVPDPNRSLAGASSISIEP